MLLGAGELGKEVIIALQRLGVEVVAVDCYPNAPGHQVAHRRHVIDMTDPAALRALIEQERPALVVPEIEAIASDALVALEQEGLCRVIPTAGAVQLTMNREGIRRLATDQLELPTSRFGFAGSANELRMVIDKAIGYPCVVKPVMSSSGKGLSSVEGPEDVQGAWEYAVRGARVRGARVIVEERIRFDYEITLLTVRVLGAGGRTETLYCDPIGHKRVDGDYVESWQPHPMTAVALAGAKHIAGAVTSALGGTGLFGVELFVQGDRVWFNEVSPRPQDTGMVTMASQCQSEFELHARAILGLPVSVAMRAPGASAVIYGGIEGAGIAFEGVDEALRVPESDLRLFGWPKAFPKRRMGVALATGSDLAQARDRARSVASGVHPVVAE